MQSIYIIEDTLYIKRFKNINNKEWGDYIKKGKYTTRDDANIIIEAPWSVVWCNYIKKGKYTTRDDASRIIEAPWSVVWCNYINKERINKGWCKYNNWGTLKCLECVFTVKHK